MCRGDPSSVVEKWDKLPEHLKLPEIKPYHENLKKKKGALRIKKAFDFLFSLFLLLLLGPVFLILALLIKLDSRGPAFYLQKRVTKNDRDFRIYKFRTMVPDAEHLGTQVTVSDDPRITKIGKQLRKYRLDELPQLINILKGEMSFVGTRPEVRKYVNEYTPQMKATLLLPAGVTSLASVLYKDEQARLDQSRQVDHTYVEEILPEKMKYNLDYLEKFSLREDVRILFLTLREVFIRR